VIFTLIETAKLCDVDPRAWLADVLARIADHPASRIEELLPWRWMAARESHQPGVVAVKQAELEARVGDLEEKSPGAAGSNLVTCAARVDDVCVTRDQFAEVFGASQSAAGGAPSWGKKRRAAHPHPLAAWTRTPPQLSHRPKTKQPPAQRLWEAPGVPAAHPHPLSG
jgi:hypothetical protein